MKNNTITDKKTIPLITANQTKREQTYACARYALHTMEKDNLPISFEGVARMAGISKAWLYKQSELCDAIKSKRDKSVILKRSSHTKARLQAKETEITTLKETLKKKNTIIKKLKAELEHAYGLLYNKHKDSW